MHLFRAAELAKTDPRYHEAITPPHALPLYLEHWQRVHQRPRSTWTAEQLEPCHRAKS